MPDPVKMVLFEDDPDDIEFLREALDEHGMAYALETVMRGDLAEQWLARQEEVPDLIIMDLNLPKIHGRDVLKLIRGNRKFSAVPVLVLTTSSLSEDKDYCLKNGADKFVTKPSSPEGFQMLAELIMRIAHRAGKTKDVNAD
jgi:DNA-binding response OmpR family regulator